MTTFTSFDGTSLFYIEEGIPDPRPPPVAIGTRGEPVEEDDGRPVAFLEEEELRAIEARERRHRGLPSLGSPICEPRILVAFCHQLVTKCHHP